MLQELSNMLHIEEPRKQISTTRYDYFNESGTLIYYKERIDFSNNTKSFYFHMADGRNGIVEGQLHYLYNFPELIKYRTSRNIFICEGEKCVDALKAIDLIATSGDTGAGHWNTVYNQYFQDSNVIVLIDNDEPGRKHGELIAKNLNLITKSLKVILLPELKLKGDVFDWLHNGHARTDLIEIVKTFPKWTPQQEESQRGQDNKLQTVDSKTLSDMSLEPIKYVISSTISIGLHLLAGAPKLGKSWLIIWLCLQIARGRKVWGHETTQGTTLYLCLEDNLNRIQSRMNIILNGEKAPNNVHFATMAKSINDGLIEQINNWMILYPDTRLIAIDTLQKVRGQHRSDNAYANDYQDASQLKQLADKHGIAILLVHHLRKMLDPDVFNMVSGSTGLTGCVDSTFVLKKEDRQSQEATLYATGRDIEEMELLLNFNKSICTWELISTDAESFKEEKGFNENPLVIAVTKMLTDNPYWNGKALDLLIALDKYSDDELPPTPNTLTRKLNELKGKLYKKNIKYFSNQKSSGTFITLEYISPLSPLSPQTQEVGMLQGNDNITIVSPLSPLSNNCNDGSGDSGGIVAIYEKADNLDISMVRGDNGDNGDNGEGMIIDDEAIEILMNGGELII